MIQTLLKHIERSPFPQPGESILVACSGGPDSMALAHLMIHAGYNVHLAHANFMLRGEDSDLDEQLVDAFAQEHNVPVHIHRFDTQKASEERGTGIQETARGLRYEWFYELMIEHELSGIATAHHKDDRLETYLWHLLRGSSLSGFTSIPETNGSVFRPLLFASKQQLIDYCAEQGIKYRDDKSNASNKYTRNRIRHELIPLLEDIRPGFDKNMQRQMEIFDEVNAIIDDFTGQLTPGMMMLTEQGLEISLDDLYEIPFQRLIMQRIAKDFGFPARRVDELVDLIYSQNGKALFSATHRIIRERNALVITSLPDKVPSKGFIETDTLELHSPIHLLISHYPRSKWTLSKEEHKAQMDLDKLQFPLVVRKWKEGDRIRPIGLEGSMKLSDLMTQAKYSTYQKEHCFVVESEGKIVWTPGLRMADHVKVEANTRRVIELQVSSSD